MTKNWTGNGNSIWKTLGASNHTDKERQSEDFYATSPVAIDKLLAEFTPHHNIYECACGQGHLSKRLTERGFNVLSSDLVYRGYGRGGVDFLETNTPPHSRDVRHTHQSALQTLYPLRSPCTRINTGRRLCDYVSENYVFRGQGAKKEDI